MQLLHPWLTVQQPTSQCPIDVSMVVQQLAIAALHRCSARSQKLACLLTRSMSMAVVYHSDTLHVHSFKNMPQLQ